MKKNKFIYYILLGLIIGVYSCQKFETNTLATGDFKEMGGPLKNLIDFPIGFGIDYAPFKDDAAYREIVAKEGSNVTFGYQMKHGAVVKDDGSLDFSRSDELYNLANAAGLEVFGHTLAWYQNQNANYLQKFTGGITVEVPNLLKNGGFEEGSGADFTGWGKYNGATSFSAGTGDEVRTGARSLKVTVAADNPGGEWSVQLASDEFETEVNKTYKVSFWVKAAAAGSSAIRLSTQPTASYQGNQNVSTSWTLIEWVFTAKDPKTRILFDLGAKANTYFIDDVTVVDEALGTPPTGEEIAADVDAALKSFVGGMVTHYKGKVKAWDVVNEPMADGNSGLRTSTNTSVDEKATDRFFWSDYLGRNYALKAFKYAATADPAALLFINEYGLESNSAKTDSLIAYVKELKSGGAKIDGIGTQMHISWNTTYAGIDDAFRKLAATGLLIRVSELDIKMNPELKKDFAPSPTTLAFQASMYQYVIESYIKHVPAAQRYGITIWGVSDKDSWLTTNGRLEFPLLYDKDYNKKPAYSGFIKGLEAK